MFNRRFPFSITFFKNFEKCFATHKNWKNVIFCHVQPAPNRPYKDIFYTFLIKKTIKNKSNFWQFLWISYQIIPTFNTTNKTITNSNCFFVHYKQWISDLFIFNLLQQFYLRLQKHFECFFILFLLFIFTSIKS